MICAPERWKLRLPRLPRTRFHHPAWCPCSVGTVSLRRKALFYRQFAAVVEAGISLDSALSDLAEGETYRPLSCRIEAVRRHVAAGEALHAALAAGHLAGAMEQALLAAGEESGRLGESLALLAQVCERQERLRGRILSAMVYPGFVLCFSGAVVTVMFYWVLPRFREVFARMNMEMPPLTKLLFGLSEHFPALALGLLFGLLAGGALWTGLRRIAAVRVWTDLIRLKLPVAGRLIRCASLSRGLRSLGVMLSAGEPMLRALELAADAAGNAAVAAAFLKLRQAALEGTSLSKAAAEIDVTDCDMTDDIDRGLSAAEQRHRVDTAKAEREEELVQIRQPRSRQRTRSRGVIDW